MCSLAKEGSPWRTFTSSTANLDMNSANSGCAAASWRFEESSGLKITQMTKGRERIIKIRVYNRCLLCILNIIYCIIVKLEVQKWIFLIKLRTPSSFLPAQPVAKRAKCGVRKHRSSRIWSWYPLGSQMNAINNQQIRTQNWENCGKYEYKVNNFPPVSPGF